MPTAMAIQCITPTRGMQIGENTLLCKGTYQLDEGFLINKDDTIVNCNNAIFEGIYANAGVRIMGAKDTLLINCTFKDYEAGVYLAGADKATMVGIKAENNEIDLRFYKSNNVTFIGCTNKIEEIESRDNNITKNSPNCKGAIPNKEKWVKRNEKKPVLKEIITHSTPIVAAETPLDLIKEITIKDTQNPLLKNNAYKIYENTKNFLKINKNLTYLPDTNTTRIDIKITITNTLPELYIYEFVPKCLAAKIEEISFNGQGPTRIIEADPLFVWYFTDLKQGDIIDLSYEVEGHPYGLPQTITVTDEVMVRTNEYICDKPPETMAIGDCLPKKQNRGWVFLPIFIIPIIAGLYIFLQKKVEKN